MSWSLNNLWGTRLDGLGYYEVASGGNTIDSIVVIEFSSHLAMETLIGGPGDDVYLWNTFFGLPANGSRFRVAAVDGAPSVILEGGKGITLRDDLFNGNLDILSIGDVGTVSAFTGSGDRVFKDAHSLAGIVLPGLLNIGGEFLKNNDIITVINFANATTIGGNAFIGMTSLNAAYLASAITLADKVFMNCHDLTTVDLSACTSLGSTVGDNIVFHGTAEIIDITLSTNTLLVCNSGGFDGDLQYLFDAGRLTVNGVVPTP